MTKVPQDTASQVTPDDDSVWQSLDDASNEDEVAFGYDKIAARQPAPTVK